MQKYLFFSKIELITKLEKIKAMKKELELYELILLLKFTSTEAETNEKIQLYKDFLTEKGSQVMVKNQGKRSFMLVVPFAVIGNP